MRDDFACMILCHGRPDNTPTYQTLLDCHYTGKIIIVCDDEDKTVDGYRQNFPKAEVQLFSKEEISKKMDAMDNRGDRRCAVYARNACFEIAEKLGLKYFCELDDDYTSMPYRYEDNGKLYRNNDSYLDDVFEAYIKFMESSDKLSAVAFGQPGDYIGGVGSMLHKRHILPKCMNSWICCTSRKFTFNGTMNDDVNTYTLCGSRGGVFYTVAGIMIDQPETQQVKGGMTDMYLGSGTYQKSFYTVMQCPSFVKVGIMGDRHYRIHHSIDAEHGYPKLISGRYKRK